MKYFFAVLIALAVAVFTLEAGAQMEIKTDPDSPPEFSSSVSCAKCHRDFYNYWKESLHAHALDDQIFQAALMMALKQKGDETRKLCLGCHAPTTLVTGDTMTPWATAMADALVMLSRSSPGSLQPSGRLPLHGPSSEMGTTMWVAPMVHS